MGDYQPYVPMTVGEVVDKLGSMMLSSPTFKDPSGYFPEKGIDTEFFSLLEGLENIRPRIGDERYEALVEMVSRMRKHFEADPSDETDDSIQGREIIDQMQLMLKSARGKR